MPVQMGLGVIQTGMLARMLGPEGIGVIALFGAICALVSTGLGLVSAEALLTFTNRSLAVGNKPAAALIVRYCFIVDLLSNTAAYAALILLAISLSGHLGIQAEFRSLLMVFGLTMVLSSTYWDSYAVLRLGNRFHWTFYQSTAHSVAKTALTAALLLRGAGLEEIVWLEVLLSALNGISLFVAASFVLRDIGIDMRWIRPAWWRVPRDVWKFQLLAYGRSSVKSANRYVDTLMIGLMADPVQVGYFRVSKQIADFLKTPTQGFVASLHPEYSRLWFSGQNEELNKLVKRFTLGFLVCGLVLACILALSIDWVIDMVLGPAFAPARVTALVLLQSALIVVVMTPLYSLPAAVGRAGPALWSVLVALLVQTVLVWLLVPSLGSTGAAWSNVGYATIWALLIAPATVSILKAPKKPPARTPSELEGASVGELK